MAAQNADASLPSLRRRIHSLKSLPPSIKAGHSARVVDIPSAVANVMSLSKAELGLELCGASVRRSCGARAPVNTRPGPG